MMKIKILYLVEDLKRGGLENIIAALARGLDQEKYAVQVWCVVAGGEVADELVKAGICVRVLNIRNYYNPFNILKLAFLLKREKFDILHAHGYFASTVGRAAGILARVPVLITHVHTIFYNLSKRNIAIDKFFNGYTHKIIFISQAVKDSFVKAGYTFGDKAVIIYNGVADTIVPKTAPDGEEKVLINVASLYAHKGQTYLLKAMKEVTVQFPQAVLWIVGDGPLKEDLKKEAQALGLGERVIFWGRRTDVRKLLSQSQIFILPSTREGIPLSILEAMAAGLPIVATRVGGVAEMVVDHKTGILCPPGEAKALAQGIISLLQDPAKCRSLGQAGRKSFEGKFTESHMLKDLDLLYQKALAN